MNKQQQISQGSPLETAKERFMEHPKEYFKKYSNESLKEHPKGTPQGNTSRKHPKGTPRGTPQV